MEKNQKKFIKKKILAVFAIIILLGVFNFIKGPYSKYKIILNTFFSGIVNKDISKEANKYLADYDYIICYDNMRIIWANSEIVELTGLDQEEIEKLRTFDVIDKDYNKVEVLSRILERMIDKEGYYEPVIEAKNGTHVKLSVHYRTFIYNEGTYLVGKVIDYKVITEEEAAEIIN